MITIVAILIPVVVTLTILQGFLASKLADLKNNLEFKSKTHEAYIEQMRRRLDSLEHPPKFKRGQKVMLGEQRDRYSYKAEAEILDFIGFKNYTNEYKILYLGSDGKYVSTVREYELTAI